MHGWLLHKSPQPFRRISKKCLFRRIWERNQGLVHEVASPCVRVTEPSLRHVQLCQALGSSDWHVRAMGSRVIWFTQCPGNLPSNRARHCCGRPAVPLSAKQKASLNAMHFPSPTVGGRADMQESMWLVKLADFMVMTGGGRRP